MALMYCLVGASAAGILIYLILILLGGDRQ